MKISTDAGIIGWGEVDGCPEVAKAVIEAGYSHTQVNGLRAMLLGEDPLATTRLWNKMYAETLYYGRSGAAIQAMAGVDIALWDIKGSALGKPMVELLGGALRDRMRVYSSNMFQFTVEATVERAKRAIDTGHTGVKFGWEPFGREEAMDLRYVEAIRRGDRRQERFHAGCRARLGRQDDDPPGQTVRAVQAVLDRGAAAPGRLPGLRQGIARLHAAHRRRRAGGDGGRLRAADRRGTDRHRADRSDPLRLHPGDAYCGVRAAARPQGLQPQFHDRYQHRRLAPFPVRDRERAGDGILRRAERDLARWRSSGSRSATATRICPPSRGWAWSRTPR